MRSIYLVSMLAMACVASYSCSKPDDVQGDDDTTPPTADSRLADCTISSIGFEGQTDTPVITISETGETAVIDFKIDPSQVDMKAVKITELSFRYENPDYIPSSSVKEGETLDLSGNSAEIVVTSHNGENTCVYTVTVTSDITFTVENPFQGTVSFDLIGGITWGSGQSFMVFVGGAGDTSKPEECDIRMTTDAELGNGKHSHGDDIANAAEDYKSMTLEEQDNIISFKYTEVDPADGTTYGTYINNSGADGKYSSFKYYAFDQPSRADDPVIDVTDIYRLLPKGRMLWSQAYNSNVIRFYDFNDTEHATVVSEVTLESKDDGNFTFPYANFNMNPNTNTIPVEHYAFHRHYEWDQFWTQLYPDKFTQDEEWSDTRYMVSNVREVFWLVDISGEPVVNHDELLNAAE